MVQLDRQCCDLGSVRRRRASAGVLSMWVLAHGGGAAWAADGTGLKAVGDIAVSVLAVAIGLPALALAVLAGVFSIRLGKRATTTKQVFLRSLLGGVAVFLFAVAALAGGALGAVALDRPHEFWSFYAAALLAALVWIAECMLSASYYLRVSRQSKGQGSAVLAVLGIVAAALLTIVVSIWFSTCAYLETHSSTWIFTWSYDGDTEEHSMTGPTGCAKQGKAYEQKVRSSRTTACGRLCGRRPGPDRQSCRDGCRAEAELTDQQCRTELRRAKK